VAHDHTIKVAIDPVLGALAAFLVFLSMLLAAAAAWWFAVLWSMTR